MARHEPPPRQRRRGGGVPARGAGGVLSEAALAPHARAGLLEGGGRERRLLVSSGAHPGPGARDLPIGSPPLQGPFGPGHIAVLAPVALADPDQHAVGRGPRPVDGSLPSGAAHRPRSSVGTCGPPGFPPSPRGSALPAGAAPLAACGFGGVAGARQPATAAAGCARRTTGCPRGESGTWPRRPASPSAGRERTGGAPLR
jgi:hypothetical protein